MNLVIHPGSPLRGTVSLPGDKSLSHRAALFAGLARGKSIIENFQISGVTRAMLEALQALELEWELDGTQLTIQGQGWKSWHAPGHVLGCGNSATTLRLLSGALSAAGVPAVLDGSPGLRRRPMGRILKPLQQMGVPIRGEDGKYAPLALEARPAESELKAIEYTLPVASAQLKSCLLLAGLAADGPVILHEPGLSRDHSERMLRQMGVSVETLSPGADPGRTVILQPPSAPLAPLHMRLPGDFSSAAFLIVAALIVPGSEVTLRGVGLNPTRTGLLEVLQEMGGDIQVTAHKTRHEEQAGEPYGDITARSSSLHSAQVSGERVVRMIDEFPIFAVAAAFAQGRSDVRQAAELRTKESDRIACLSEELAKLGCQVEQAPDGFSIQGPLHLAGGSVRPHGDHRLAMALAVAGLASTGPVCVQDAGIIRESFPEFVDVLSSLGAEIHLEEEG